MGQCGGGEEALEWGSVRGGEEALEWDRVSDQLFLGWGWGGGAV